jgi:hypothetical protein
MTLEELKALTTSIVVDLKAEPTQEDIRVGWTDSARSRWLEHFVDLRERLEAGQTTLGDERHLMRWLNFDGIGVGALASKMRRLQQELLSSTQNPSRD